MRARCRAHSNSASGFTHRDFAKIGWRETSDHSYNPACILLRMIAHIRRAFVRAESD